MSRSTVSAASAAVSQAVVSTLPFVGIDVCKETLDVFGITDNKILSVANSPKGV